MNWTSRFTAAMSFAIAVVSAAHAAPAVTGVSGTTATGQTIRINGSGFGAKSPAAPLVWADFESGINPTSLGQKTTWSRVQSLSQSTEGFQGSKGAKASDGSGAWSLRVDHDSWTREGQRSYIYRKQRLNFEITSTSQNWKIWRMWPSGTNYPNIYIAAHNGRAFVENIGTESGFWGNFKSPGTGWNTEEIIFKASSAQNVKDGQLIFRVNGAEKSRGSILSRSSASPAYMTQNYVVHAILANASQWSPAWSSNNRVWVDDVYVDNTWSRVMIGDSSTLSSCTRLDIQVPTAWADGSVTVVANTRSFASGSRAYLYVFDRDNSVNSTGYPVTIGQGSVAANTAPTANAGADRTVTIGQSVSLAGQASDDGLPNPPASLTSTWTQVLGPAAAVIASPSSLTSAVSFPMVGQYTFRLTVSDGALSRTDDVTFTIQAVNQPPSVNAGPDSTAVAGAVLNVTGVVSDDGLPNPPGATAVTWASITGPAAPTISEANSLSTDIRFPAAGTYTIRLTANDGALTASDSRTVVVSAAPTVNAAPVADAGPDASVTLPDQANLSGSAGDDGLPAGSSIVYAWEKVSGPGLVGFGDVNQPSTWASFSLPGDYTLRLTASDGELSSSDLVAITVAPAVVSSSGRPVIAGVSGRLLPGGTLNITGSGFADKVPAAPLVWADFEQGLQPGAQGLLRAWNEVENMQWSREGFNGTGGAKASDGNGVWTIRADFRDWTRDGQKAYVFKKQRTNFLITSDTQNWKIWRMWPSTFGYPNVYAAAHNGRVYVENIGTESGFWGAFRQGTTQWSTEETIFQASSAIDRKDGLLVIRYDGVERTRGSLLTRSSVSPSVMTLNYVVHGVAANKGSWSPAWNTTNRLWVDDVYVDTTWARVMIGDAASFTACRKLEVQIPTSWSNTSISVSARPGQFPKSARVYLYVVDKDGNVNSEGYPMIVDSKAVGSLVDGGTTDESSTDERAKNHFNPAKGEQASLTYVLRERGSVKVIIFDRGGRRVKELDGEERLEGEHSIAWDGRNDDGSIVASGIYLAVTKGSDGSRTRHKIAVIK